MLTRRSFLGTVAALAVSPVASKAVPVAVDPDAVAYGWRAIDHNLYIYGGHAGGGKSLAIDAGFWPPRRDDGDTILELR